MKSRQTVNGELPMTFFPHEIVVVETEVLFDSQQLGWAKLDVNCCPDMLSQVVYRKQQSGRPDLMTTTPFGSSEKKTTVYFDNTDSKYTGVGLVNSDRIWSFGENEITVDVVVRDVSGIEVSRKARKIKNQNFHWFNLAAEYPETGNRRGTITFISPTMYITSFSLQFTPNAAFTSIVSGDYF